MLVLVFITLFLTDPFAFAHGGTQKPWMNRPPTCDQILANVDGYLHDRGDRAPIDNPALNKDGFVTDQASLEPDAMVRELSEGSYLKEAFGGLATLVRPRSRGVMQVTGFYDRIPRRDQRYIRASKDRGVFTTADEAFFAVLDMCAGVERHDYDRVTGQRRKTVAGEPVKLNTWLTDDVRQFYQRMHLHPEGYAHSRELWHPLPDGGRRLVGGLIWLDIAGVASGETMCLDRSVASNDGKLLFHDTLDQLENEGFPWLDVQEVQPERLPARWGAFEEPRANYDERVSDRHEEYISADRNARTP